MKHIIVIPYYCDEEVRRYLWIADFLAKITKMSNAIEFLLCSRSSINQSSKNLLDAFSKISYTCIYQCKNKTTGYPQGASAMFWEIMDYIAANYEKDKGFVLWLESDMIPVRSDWVNRLNEEWVSVPDLLLMGRYIMPFETPRVPVPGHINGGGCYSKDIAGYVPSEARKLFFDVDLFPFIRETKRWKPSAAFAFTTLWNISEHMQDMSKVILHGYYQDKDKFIRACVQKATTLPVNVNPICSGVRKLFHFTKWHHCCPLRYRKKLRFYCPIHSQS